MKFPSKTIMFMAKVFPGVFSKESVEKMVVADQISIEAAGACFVQAEARSAEAVQGSGVPTDGLEGIDKDALDKIAKEQYFANVKFQAMLSQLKEDDTFLHDEFVSIDNARNKAIADIVATRERDFNMMLQSLKTADGVDKEVIDSLLQTKLKVEDIR